MVETVSIVIYSKDHSLQTAYNEMLKQIGGQHNYHSYSDPYYLLTEIEQLQSDLIIIELDRNDVKGIELLARLLQIKLNIPILIVAYDNQYALEALQKGVLDYLVRPIKAQDFEKVIKYLRNNLTCHLINRNYSRGATI